MKVEHQVWLKFKPGTSPEVIQGHIAGLASLKKIIPEVLALKIGTNFTERAQGYTHGLAVTVGSRAGFKTYLEHLEHVRVATAVRKDADVMALDFEFSE